MFIKNITFNYCRDFFYVQDKSAYCDAAQRQLFDVLGSRLVCLQIAILQFHAAQTPIRIKAAAKI